VMVGGAVGQVMESHEPRLQPGDFVSGYWGWRDHVVTPAAWLQKLDPQTAPVSTALGVLGMPGMTAYFGFLDICHPKSGETVVVSGAAGAVGSLVGQIAKIHGCRAIGIAGTDQKIRHVVEELGFDGAFNYKTTSDYAEKLKELCPNGIDCYFDNVGGAISDAVIALLNPFGRVSVCGQISQYNLQKSEPGPRILGQILVRQLKVEGFIVTRFQERWPQGIAQMARWIQEGKLRYREDIVAGFEKTPRAFIDMLEGKNTGKMLVKA
jgi:NADPH-dependent curcumin reductase CurA